MILAFFGNWDATALGTLALAAATFASLIFARRSLGQMQQQIKLGQAQLGQTQAEIALSRREVEEAHRPVVVPVVVARPSSMASVSASSLTAPERPRLVGDGVLGVPIKNIGSGPALNITAGVLRLNADGSTWNGPIEPQTPGIIAGLGKEAVVPIEIRAHGWEERWDFGLTIIYKDVAGKCWETVCRYVAARRRFEDVTVKPLAGSRPKNDGTPAALDTFRGSS